MTNRLRNKKQTDFSDLTDLPRVFALFAFFWFLLIRKCSPLFFLRRTLSSVSTIVRSNLDNSLIQVLFKKAGNN